MQVILLERIGRLGQMGDTVTVKDGYARNYLLPQGKALRANKANLERFENERATLETRNLELKSEAESVSTKLNEQTFVAIRQASDTGQLYGSVSTRDIADIVTEAGFVVGRNQVQLDKPIKTLGIHPLRVSLHPEVSVTVSVNVARTDEEAARQARGEDITAQDNDDFEEDTISAEEVFEDTDLAKQAEDTLEDGAEGEESDVSTEEATDDSAETEADSDSDSADDEKKDD